MIIADKKHLRWFLILFLWLLPLQADQSVVTYRFSGGRFGDNLLAYLHGKWFAYEHNLPFLYKPFPYSEYLALHENEIRYRNRNLRKELNLRPWFKVSTKRWNVCSKIPFFSFCYECPYFPEDSEEIKQGNFYSFPVNWKDETFRKMLQTLVAPSQELVLTKPPSGMISVAIHVRDGGGFDKGFYRSELPLKFPPISFYQQGIKQIAQLFPDQPIYCHVFTDAQKPEKVVSEIKSGLSPQLPIEFGFRKEENFHNLNVLEDFFSLFEYDILIRPQSNFSLIPSLLKDYAAVFAPAKISSNDTEIWISDVDFTINQELYQRLLQ